MTVETLESLCLRARQAIAQGHTDLARQLFLQALGLRSDAPDVHYGLATACFLLHDLDSAAYHFKEVTRLDPLRPGAYINLGAVYNRLEEYEEAVQILRRGIQIDPHRAEGYYNLGLVYKNMGQPSLAVQAYLEATRIDPQMIDAHYNLGNLYLEIARYQLALAHYKKVLQLRPNWDKALAGLTHAEQALGITASLTNQDAAETKISTPELSDLALNRSVDPALHSDLLHVLHQTTADSESQSRQFLQVLEHEIEPVLKELATRLLGTGKVRTDLSVCVRKFETAIENMRKVQGKLANNVQKVKTLGDRLLKT